MSQIYKALTSGPVPPVVPTSFETDNGTAVPLANLLIINGVDSIEDNDNGITVKGGVVGTGTSNKVEVVLTNRIQGSVTTTDATPTTIITFPATTAGTYIFEVKSAAFNLTDSRSAGYSIFATVRSDGVNTFLAGSPDKIKNEETLAPSMAGCDFSVVVGGIADTNVYFQVTGLSTGPGVPVIDWCAVGLYCTIS